MIERKAKSQTTNRLKQILTVATGAFALVATDLLMYQIFGIAISCPWFQLTGWYCPGCGGTRMLLALMHGEFYQAVRYNALLLSLLPFGVWLLGDSIYHTMKGGNKVVDRIPEWFWALLIVAALLFGLLRNLDTFSFLAPTAL